jgi:multiple antibiotic resistance protein
MLSTDSSLLMFMALFALYSPLAALSAYLPVVGRFSRSDQLRLAIGLFINVSVFALAAVWIGEPLLGLLGVTTAALSVTGGIALLYAGVPMMQGIDEKAGASEPAEHAPAPTPDDRQEDWRSVLFTPITFPLTVGGTSFGLIVAFAASADEVVEDAYLSLAGIAYAAVTGITVYAAGELNRHVSHKARAALSRVAGILLTAIAVSLVANGGTRLVVETLESLGKM